MQQGFFEEPEKPSLLKSQIVLKYFVAWARIIAKHAERIGYFDFFSGPGRYQSGQKSTPLLILETAIASEDLRSRLVSMFNDANSEFTSALQLEIDNLPGTGSLKYAPQVITGKVGEEFPEYFERIKTIPSLSFIDPWGYKGLSLRLIRSVLKDWGCEVLFFFNYNRINMGINNPKVQEHMEALFGAGLPELRASLEGQPPGERESTIRDVLTQALREMGGPYLLPFTFRRKDGRVSHYICFVSKHPLGYSIMKEIMAAESDIDDDGVPLYESSPLGATRQLPLGYMRPILTLPEDLLRSFAEKTLTVGEIFKQHNVGRPFVKRNYKRVLIEMEEDCLIKCEPDAGNRNRGTIADRILVTFP
jgi:three-Cys-motif partner protein